MWKSVSEGVVSGVATAITGAILLFGLSLLRNLILESKIRRSFGNVGYSTGVNAFGLVLTNRTKIPVRVWAVGLCLQKSTFEMNYSGTKSACRIVAYKLPNEKKSFRTTINCHSFSSEPEDGAVTLDFEMSATWVLSNSVVATLSVEPQAAFCIVEYQTLIGIRKRINIDVARPDALRGFFQAHRSDCLAKPEIMNVHRNAGQIPSAFFNQ